MRVEHLIIGAGMAGLVLAHRLGRSRVRVVDPNPGGYKIGESVVPEQFHHPVMRALLPEVERLPSYSPKYGTTFVSGDSVASFPLPKEEAGVAMHVSRSEIESLMRRAWSVEVARERVLSVDLERRCVRTDRETYEVEGLVLDCSGPAMVLGAALGDARSLWPIWATWGYFDLLERDDAAFHRALRAEGKRYLRYDALRREVLPDGEIEGWSPSRTTLLTREEGGLWTWQIPLHGSTMLSFGAVSRDGEVSPERLFELAQTRQAPGFRLAPRPDDGTPFGRVHRRSHFARRCETAATERFVRVGDAFAFGDPVYSVGSAIAVNRALELADVLEARGWSADCARVWCADSESQLARAIEGFEFWYSGDLLERSEAAAAVRDELLLGSAFQVKSARHYGAMLRDAGLNKGPHRRALDPAYALAWRRPDPALASAGRELDARTGTGWSLDAAARGEGRLYLRWRRPDAPPLTVMIFSDDRAPCYARAGGFALSYLNLLDGPYPMDDAARALLDAITSDLARRAGVWRGLGDVAESAHG